MLWASRFKEVLNNIWTLTSMKFCENRIFSHSEATPATITTYEDVPLVRFCLSKT